MILATIQGEVISIKKNSYTNKENGKLYESFRIFLMNTADDFNPVLTISFDFTAGLALGWDNEEIVTKLHNKVCKFSVKDPRSYQGKLSLSYDTFDVVK